MLQLLNLIIYYLFIIYLIINYLLITSYYYIIC